jgi:benzoyl-CoA reductase subunit C
MKRTSVVDWAMARYEDLDLLGVQEWLADNPGKKATGYLPVYAPREIIRAAGMLPVGIHGGGDRLEIIRGDAYYQSYICHLPRSVVELALSGRLDCLSAVLFPSTCDVIRNLSGMWMMMKPEVYVRYVDVPQVRDQATGGAFWKQEVETLWRELCEVAGTKPDPVLLTESITTYNRFRLRLRELYAARQKAPWKMPSWELYVLLRAAEVVPVDEWLLRSAAYLRSVEASTARPKDNSRVIVVGSFCEQPPLGLIKTIERAGCYIVDDDFLLGQRILGDPVPVDGDPVEQFSSAFIERARECSILYEAASDAKRTLMSRRVKEAKADGIVFAAPSFCDPALLDQPMLKGGADADGIPSIAFKYAENTGQFQQFREQAGTFSDAIKLWGGA